MEDYTVLTLKRKDLEEFNVDFSDFSLSAPARKIRRLDFELPRIVEEEESEMPFVSERTTSMEPASGYNSSSVVKIEELSSEPLNEERAIVLFNPNNIAVPPSPSSFSISVSPQILSGFKNHVLLPGKSSILTGPDDKEPENDSSSSDSRCLAVVPWQPSFATEVQVEDNSDMMDAQAVEELDSMDIEDNSAGYKQGGGVFVGDGFHQWQQQQQHCLVPPPQQTANAPVVWYR